MRGWQKHSVAAGKNFHHSGGCGPWMVTADEIDDPGDLLLGLASDAERRLALESQRHERVAAAPARL